MKTQCPLRFLSLVPCNEILVFVFALNLSLALGHAQQTQPPADPCNGIKASAPGLTSDLQILCRDVIRASGGKSYSDDLANQILSNQQVAIDFGIILPSKRDEFKRQFAVLQIRNSNASSAAINSQNAIKATTANRPDQQTTAAQSIDAATSLVQKAAGPELLSFALESGALTQSTTGNTSTLSGNLEGILYTVAGEDPVCFTSCTLLREFLGDINTTTTFTMDQPSTTTTTSTTPATGSSPAAGTAVSTPSSVGKLSGISAKFLILNKFDPHSATFRKNWNSAVANDKVYGNIAANLMKANATLSAELLKVEETSWPNEKKNLISTILASPNELDGQYESIAQSEFQNATLDQTALSTYLQSYSSLQADWETIRQQAAGTLATIQYSFAKPANQPETHTVTGILSYAPQTSTANSLLTVNFGVSVYGGAIPAGANYGRLQYGQVSAEFDRILFSPSSTGPVNLNLAGYWQYQPNPSVLNITQANVAPGTTIAAPTQVLVGTAGSLFVAQAQLQYKNSSGLSIPFGVKWSNNTELLTGNKVGAQVGISYDFSFLSNMLNPSSK
jgi:hypothetical protein